MLTILRKFIRMLNPREKRRFGFLIAIIVAMGFANMVGVASIIPFVSVLASPEVIHTNKRLFAVYDALGFQSDFAFLIFLGGVVATAFMIVVVVKALSRYAIVRFGTLRTYSVSVRILEGHLGQPYPWFLNRHSADIAKTVLGEVSQAVSGCIMPMLMAFSSFVVSAFLIVLLVIVNPVAAMSAAAVLLATYGLVFVLLRKKLAMHGSRRVAANRARFRAAQETLAGIKEIKVLGLERAAVRRFDAASRRFAEAAARSGVLGEVPQQIIEGVIFVAMVAATLALYASYGGEFSAMAPVIGVYALAGLRLLPAMRVIFKNLARARSSAAAFDNVYAGFISSAKRRDELRALGPVDPLPLREKITLENVEYRYPKMEQTALAGVSFEIPAGGSVGLVGGTGAGKTTLVDIILGLLKPSGGVMRVDGRAIDDDEMRRRWRASLGYVPQNIFLTHGTIAENIAFGRPAAAIDMEAVERAAKVAQIHDFVMNEMEQGYQTQVGDRGVRLSGGQRQRIGIARALYRDPQVLIFDEATAALDNVTEAAFMKAISEIGRTKTVVMIAHRLTTVRDCDEIILLEGGVVAGRGSFDELVRSNESFREMAGGVA